MDTTIFSADMLSTDICRRAVPSGPYIIPSASAGTCERYDLLRCMLNNVASVHRNRNFSDRA
jgi:hypothetical protein